MEDRIVELEKKIGFLEKYTEDLSSVIFEQGKIIEALKKKISLLDSKILSSPLDYHMPHNEKPPHY